MGNRREELNKIFAQAAEQGIPVPGDVLLEIGKRDAQALISVSEQNLRALLDAGLLEVRARIEGLDKLPELWRTDALDGMISPYQLPIFTLTLPGAVPAPGKLGLVLTSLGWTTMPQLVTYVGGRGGARLPANALGWLHNDGTGVLVWSTPAGGTPDHAALLNLTFATAQHVGFPGLWVANLFTADNRGTEFIGTRSGTITRDVNGRITIVAKTAGRTITITRDVNGYITSATDATNTWTFTRDINNIITSWAVT